MDNTTVKNININLVTSPFVSMLTYTTSHAYYPHIFTGGSSVADVDADIRRKSHDCQCQRPADRDGRPPSLQDANTKVGRRPCRTVGQEGPKCKTWTSLCSFVCPICCLFTHSNFHRKLSDRLGATKTLMQGERTQRYSGCCCTADGARRK